MNVDLRYGEGSLAVKLPANADVTVIRKPAMPVVPNPREAMLEAIQRPIASEPLAVLAGQARSAAIAICDITRPVPNHLFLRPLIETLLQHGIPPQGITVIVATGLHRPNEGPELLELVGDPWVLDHVQVVNHFARSDEDHVDLGRTPTRGTVVKLDRRFVEADIRIATGLVEPHFMAGYSGGRKVVAPGLAHAETITTFHSARFMANPAARNCNLEANPLHEEQLAIIEMLGPVLGLNTVIDEARQLSFVSFGDILASHQAAVAFVRPFCEVPLDQRFGTVITSAAGYPLDKTYYQTVKGMVGAMGILKPGGDLIIASECSEGMGSAEFVAAQQRLVELGPKAFLASILAKSHADIDEWQSQMQLKPMERGNIHLYSALAKQDQRFTGVHCIDSVEATVAESCARRGDHSIAVIPEGPYVVPFSREPTAVP